MVNIKTLQKVLGSAHKVRNSSANDYEIHSKNNDSDYDAGPRAAKEVSNKLTKAGVKHGIAGWSSDGKTHKTYIRLSEDMNEEFKIGDHVHLGLGVKGGAGFRGKLIKIDGGEVTVRAHTQDKWGARVWKGRLKNLSHDED